MNDKDFRENISNQVISITLEDCDTDVECRVCNYLSDDDNDYETDGDMLCDDCKREVEQCYQKYSDERKKGSKFSNERFDRKKVVRKSGSSEKRVERKRELEPCSCKVQCKIQRSTSADPNLNQKINGKREAELLSKGNGVEKKKHHSSECLKDDSKEARKQYRTKESDGSVRRTHQPKECKCCPCDKIQIKNKKPSEQSRNQKHQEKKDSNSCRKTSQSCNFKSNATSCEDKGFKENKYDLCERLNHNFDKEINKYKNMNEIVDRNQCEKSNGTKKSQLYEKKGLEMKNQRSCDSLKKSGKKYETKESDCSEIRRNRPKELNNNCSCNMNHSMQRSSTVELSTNQKFQERKSLNCERRPSQSCNDFKHPDFIQPKDPEKKKYNTRERIKHDEDRKNIKMKKSNSLERKKYQIKESNSTECKKYQRNKSESTESKIYQRKKYDCTKRKKYQVKEHDSNERVGRVVYQPKESNSFSTKTVIKSNAIKRSKTEHSTTQKYRERKDSNHRRRTLQGCNSTRSAEITPKDFQKKKYVSCESINPDIDENTKKSRVIEHVPSDRMTMHAKESNMRPCKTRCKSDTPEKSESGERSPNQKLRGKKASNNSNNLILSSKKEDEIVTIKNQQRTQHSNDRVSYNFDQGRNKHCQKEFVCNDKNVTYSCKRCSEICNCKYDNYDYKTSKDQKVINKVGIIIDPQLENNDQNGQCQPLDKCNWPVCDKCRKRKDPQKKKKKNVCAMKIQKYLEHCLKPSVELKSESRNSVYSRTTEDERSTEFTCKCVPISRNSNHRQRKQTVLSDDEIQSVRKNRADMNLSQDSITCGSSGEVTDNSCSSAENKGINQNKCSSTSQDKRNNQITDLPSSSKICIYSMPKKKRRENNGDLPIRYKTCDRSVCRNKARGMKEEESNANYLKVREICERLKDIRKQFSDTKKHHRRDTSASYSPEFLSNSQAAFHNHSKGNNASKSSTNRKKDRGCISQACQTEFVCKCLSSSKNSNHCQRNQTSLSDVEIETVNIESCKVNNELHKDHKKKRLKLSEHIKRSRDSYTDEEHEHDSVKECQTYKSPRNSNSQKHSSQRMCSKIKSPSFKKHQPRINTIKEQYSLHEDKNGQNSEESSREKILYICENRKVSKCYMKQKESKDQTWDNEKESKNLFEREFQKLQKNLKKDKKNKPSTKNGRTCDKLKAKIEKYCNCHI